MSRLQNSARSTNFNSRPSARGDQRTHTLGLVNLISIHAPPRGATLFSIRRASGLHFNSRPSARGDSPPKPRRFARTISIHAPPRGATAAASTMAGLSSYFNSRPSARGDAIEARARSGYAISIHAPPRGATAKDMQFLQIFCSTLTNQHGLTIVPRNLSRLSW